MQLPFDLSSGPMAVVALAVAAGALVALAVTSPAAAVHRASSPAASAAGAAMRVGAILPKLANRPPVSPYASPPTAPATAAALPSNTPAPTPTPRPSDPPASSRTPPPATASPAATAEPTATLRAGCRQGLADPAFEVPAAWAVSSEADRTVLTAAAARSGRVGLRLGGASGIDAAEAAVGVPTLADGAGTVHLSLWLRRRTAEDPIGPAGDYLMVAVRGDVPEAIEPVLSVTDVDPPPDGTAAWSPGGWHHLSMDVTASFLAREDFASAALLFAVIPDGDDRSTVFDLDDASVEVCP